MPLPDQMWAQQKLQEVHNTSNNCAVTEWVQVYLLVFCGSLVLHANSQSASAHAAANDTMNVCWRSVQEGQEEQGLGTDCHA